MATEVFETFADIKEAIAAGAGVVGGDARGIETFAIVFDGDPQGVVFLAEGDAGPLGAGVFDDIDEQFADGAEEDDAIIGV